MSVIGAAVLLSIVLWVSWGHFKSSLPPSEDEEELQRLSQMAAALEERAHMREHNNFVLTQLPRLAEDADVSVAEDGLDADAAAQSGHSHTYGRMPGGAEFFTDHVSRRVDDILDISTPVRSCAARMPSCVTC